MHAETREANATPLYSNYSAKKMHSHKKYMKNSKWLGLKMVTLKCVLNFLCRRFYTNISFSDAQRILRVNAATCFKGHLIVYIFRA